jgi:hypothetical protein
MAIGGCCIYPQMATGGHLWLSVATCRAPEIHS